MRLRVRSKTPAAFPGPSMISVRQSLLAVSLAVVGCAPPPPPPVRPAPAPQVEVDPCDALPRRARAPNSLRLDGSAEARLVASCATRDLSDTLHVVATSPDLSVLRPSGFSHLHLVFEVPDPAAALATLSLPDRTSRITLDCRPGERIPAADALRLPTWALAGTCLSFSVRPESLLNESYWQIRLDPGISRGDFDALMEFARSRTPRFTLPASATAWAGAFDDLPVRPGHVTVLCRPEDAAVDLAALARVRTIHTLALGGPCRLEKVGDIDAPAPFQGLSSVVWSTQDGAVDLHGVRAFAPAERVSIHAKKIVGGPELAGLGRLRQLLLDGPLDAEPPGKELRWLSELTVSGPAPGFVADLPSLRRLAMGTCGPVRSASLRSMKCTPAPADPAPVSGSSPAKQVSGGLDLRGLPGLESLHLDGPCLQLASKSLTELSCTLDRPVSFRGAPNLTSLKLTLGPDMNSLSPLAEVQKLATLSLTARSAGRVSLSPLARSTGLVSLRLDAGCFDGLELLYGLPRLASVLAPRPPPAPPGSRLEVRVSGQDTCPLAAVAR